MSKIKAIVFDIGGVMAMENNLKFHYPPMCKAMKIDEKEFFKIREKYISDAAEGKISSKNMINLISNKLCVNSSELWSNWIKYKKKSIKKNFELEKIIKNLKRKGYKVGSLSNVLDIHQKAGKEAGLYDIFDFNIYSFKLGFSKPDKRIYKFLIKKLKLKPEEIVFIDDYQICLDGAFKLGINTILFRGNEKLIKDLKMLGVEVR